MITFPANCVTVASASQTLSECETGSSNSAVQLCERDVDELTDFAFGQRDLEPLLHGALSPHFCQGGSRSQTIGRIRQSVTTILEISPQTLSLDP